MVVFFFVCDCVKVLGDFSCFSCYLIHSLVFRGGWEGVFYLPQGCILCIY